MSINFVKQSFKKSVRILLHTTLNKTILLRCKQIRPLEKKELQT